MALLAAQTHGSADSLLKASPFRLDRIIAATAPTALPQPSQLGASKGGRARTTVEGCAAAGMEPSSICDIVAASEYCPDDDGMMMTLCEPTRPILVHDTLVAGPNEECGSLTPPNVPAPDASGDEGLQMRLLKFQSWLGELTLRKQHLADRCAAHRRLQSM